MKKSTIWLLAIIMALTFTSLLFMQITYIENMVRMRNEQFSEAVKRSLYAVSSQLEQDETKRYLAEDIEENQKRLLSIERGGTSVTQQWSIVSADGSISTLNVQEFTFSLPEKVTVPKTNSGSSITGGRSSFNMKFSSYELVPGDIQEKLLKEYEATQTEE